MNYRSLILPTLLVLSTIAATRYYWPRIETKTVVSERETVRKDVRTITRIVERPDGTKETIIDELDKSKERRQSTSESVVLAKADWLISATAVKDVTNSDVQPAIGLHVARRVVGPVFVGLLVNNRADVGLSVGLEF